MTMDETSIHSADLRKQFDRFRSMLFPYAYNVIGDSLAAQDVVQTLLNQYFLEQQTDVQNPSAYLIRSVINRSINEKKTLRRRKEFYPGQWLPTPVITEDNVYANADREKILQYSLLVLLEQLGAKERAVFILKETFDIPHDEIAEILNIDQAHSRQLLKRSKEKISTKIRQKEAAQKHKELLSELAIAISHADVETTKRLLAEDVKSISDGGPNRSAARKILSGFDRVTKFLQAIYGKYHPEGTTSGFAIVNHSPAIVFRFHGEIFRCMIFDINDDRIDNIFIIVNPDKLTALEIEG